MSEEVEEAITDCQKIIKYNNEVVKEARKNGDINEMQLTASLDRESKSIEILINHIKELEKERDGIYEDYQDLGKEHSKLEDRNKELEKR